MRRPLRRRRLPIARAAQIWHPSGEPYQTWEAYVADDDGCASKEVFAVRWVRPDAPRACIVTCFYPAYYGDDGFVLGAAWQQQAAQPGGGLWVYTGWDDLGDWDADLAQAADRARRAAARFSSSLAPLPQLSESGINPFAWDSVPDCRGYGRAFPQTWVEV